MGYCKINNSFLFYFLYLCVIILQVVFKTTCDRSENIMEDDYELQNYYRYRWRNNRGNIIR